MKLKFKATSAAVMAALFIGAPMSAHAILQDTEARTKINEMRSQIAEITARLDKIAPALARIDSKAETKSMMDLSGEFEKLRSELAGLRGQLEIVSNEVANAQKRQRDFYVDLDQRLRNVEQKQVALESKAAEPKSGSDQKAAEQRAAAEQKAAEQKALDAALSQFKAGDYNNAAESLTTFLQRHPDSPLAAQAHFWLGNSHFAMLDCPKAIPSYQTVITRYANSQRVPEAMLNLGSCQLDLNDRSAARDTFSLLVRKFPNSNAAGAAKERLADLK